jgi:hypothetical protein
MPNGIFSGIKGNKADMQPGLLRLSSWKKNTIPKTIIYRMIYIDLANQISITKKYPRANSTTTICIRVLW